MRLEKIAFCTSCHTRALLPLALVSLSLVLGGSAQADTPDQPPASQPPQATPPSREDGYEAFSKSEIESFRKPEMGEPILAPVKNGVVGFLKTLANDQGTMTKLRDLQAKFAPPSDSDYQLRFAASKFDLLTTDTDANAIQTQLSSSSKSLLQANLTKKLTFLDRLKSGLDFKLKLGSLFSDAPAKPKPAAPSPIHYGLVLQDIQPGNDGELQAANGPFMADELAYAGHAKTIWTVGPVDPNQNDRRLFNISSPESEKPRSDERNESPWQSFKRIVASFKYPTPDFSGQIKPRSDAPPSESSLKGLPPLQLSLQQVEGYYTVDYLTKSNFKKDAIRHTVSIPIVYELRVAQQMDERFKPVKTSAQNVLLYSDMPTVNLNYLNQEHRYQSDLKYARSGYEVTFTADTPKDWKPRDFTKADGEKYEVKINTTF